MPAPAARFNSFLGCPLPDQATACLWQWRQSATPDLALPDGHSAVRWTRRASWHITLHYLGPTVEEDITAWRGAFGAAITAYSPFAIALHTPTPYGGRARTRGLWSEVEVPGQQLQRMHADLQATLQGLGVESASAPLRPHVTLARLPRRLSRAQRHRTSDRVARAALRHRMAPCPSAIDAVHWYRSVQQRGGNLYRPLVTWPLEAK